jgi:hypothetical protein
MQVSAEIRWFWQGAPPSGLEEWFKADAHCCPVGGGRGGRLDEYLLDDKQVELSLKYRDGKPGVEVKSLVAVTWGSLMVGPFTGPIEIWTKLTSGPLEFTKKTIKIEKQRWLRKFDTSGFLPKEIVVGIDEKPLNDPLPTLGCNVELTKIKLSNCDVWWTLGFEAFGKIHTVENDLRAVATVLFRRKPPTFEDGLIASYPAWINELTREM